MNGVNRITRLTLIASILLANVQASMAAVSEKQWSELMGDLGQQKWEEANMLSTKLLKDMEISDERLPRLRYICLYAAAGQVSEGKISFEKLAEFVKPFVGNTVVLPYREFGSSKEHGSLNFIKPVENSKENLFVAASNSTGTTIHDFEYIKLKKPFDTEAHVGEQASISGTVESIEPNPNKSLAIVMRIHIADAEVKLREKQP